METAFLENNVYVAAGKIVYCLTVVNVFSFFLPICVLTYE